MQRVLIVSGTLGLGTALVFGAAALTATLFPTGPMVQGGWNGGIMMEKNFGGRIAVPMPAVDVAVPQPLVDDVFPVEVEVDSIGEPEAGVRN